MRLVKCLLTRDLRPAPGTVIEVPSSSSGQVYPLTWFGGRWECPCRGYRYHLGACRHQPEAELRWQSTLWR